MTIEHDIITDPDIHEPKGVSTAAVKEVYFADGVGGGAWEAISPIKLSGLSTNGDANQYILTDGVGGFKYVSDSHGSIYFVNFTTPYTLTYPSSFTKAAATTIASGHGQNFIEATTGRLTYTGTPSIDIDVVVGLTLDQTSGSNRLIRIAIYKNGVKLAASECGSTVQNGVLQQLGVHADTQLSTNDYLEVYLQNDGVSGDIRIYSYSFSAKIIGIT